MFAEVYGDLGRCIAVLIGIASKGSSLRIGSYLFRILSCHVQLLVAIRALYLLLVFLNFMLLWFPKYKGIDE